VQPVLPAPFQQLTGLSSEGAHVGSNASTQGGVNTGAVGVSPEVPQLNEDATTPDLSAGSWLGQHWVVLADPRSGQLTEALAVFP